MSFCIVLAVYTYTIAQILKKDVLSIRCGSAKNRSALNLNIAYNVNFKEMYQ